MNDTHCATAEHKGRTHHDRIPDCFRKPAGCFKVDSHTAGGLQNIQILNQGAEILTVFRKSDILRLRADNGNARFLQCHGDIERSLSAELHNHPVWLFSVADGKHVFRRHRLEIQGISRIIVSGNRFGVRVDHNGFYAEFTQGKTRLHAAIVKFQSLPDTVRTAADDNDFARKTACCGAHMGCMQRIGRNRIVR